MNQLNNNKNKNFIFTNDWICGFTQSDGSFVVSFENQKNGLPIRPKPIFNITQSVKELEMFKALQNYLKIGRIQINRNNVTLVVTKIDDIITNLIPLFDNSPLRGGKLLSYKIFKEVCLMMRI